MEAPNKLKNVEDTQESRCWVVPIVSESNPLGREGEMLEDEEENEEEQEQQEERNVEECASTFKKASTSVIKEDSLHF